MKNYLLKVDKDEVVVSGDEYSQIKEGIRNKINLVFLREGKLVINPIMIKLIQETNKPTEIQEKAHEGQLRLSPEDRKPATEDKKTRILTGGFQRVMGGGDDGFKDCKVCGASHFLADREICLGCAANEIKL